MDEHYGKTIEKFIRRNGYSISELARLTNVNRGVIYTWFNQRYLKKGIILQIGKALNYNFSNDFPELFSSDTIESAKRDIFTLEDKDTYYWKTKYIDLLEEHKELLISNINRRSLKKVSTKSVA